MLPVGTAWKQSLETARQTAVAHGHAVPKAAISLTAPIPALVAHTGGAVLAQKDDSAVIHLKAQVSKLKEESDALKAQVAAMQMQQASLIAQVASLKVWWSSNSLVFPPILHIYSLRLPLQFS